MLAALSSALPRQPCRPQQPRRSRCRPAASAAGGSGEGEDDGPPPQLPLLPPPPAPQPAMSERAVPTAAAAAAADDFAPKWAEEYKRQQHVSLPALAAAGAAAQDSGGDDGGSGGEPFLLPLMLLRKAKLPTESVPLQIFESRYRLMFKLVRCWRGGLLVVGLLLLLFSAAAAARAQARAVEGRGGPCPEAARRHPGPSIACSPGAADHLLPWLCSRAQVNQSASRRFGVVLADSNNGQMESGEGGAGASGVARGSSARRCQHPPAARAP